MAAGVGVVRATQADIVAGGARGARARAALGAVPLRAARARHRRLRPAHRYAFNISQKNIRLYK